jgi:hypothetical protein
MKAAPLDAPSAWEGHVNGKLDLPYMKVQLHDGKIPLEPCFLEPKDWEE